MTRLALILFLVGLPAWLFAALARRVARGARFGFDETLLRAFRTSEAPHDPIGPVYLQEAVRDITSLGSSTLVASASLLAALAFWLAGRRREALQLPLSLLLCFATSHAFKVTLDRGRPEASLHRQTVFDASFPSGHCAVAALFFFLLAHLATRGATSALRRLAFLAAATITTLVAASRVYLGVHWPSDVLAGMALGIAFAAASALLIRNPRDTTRKPTSIEAPPRRSEEATS